jgi:hypothetical protein
MSPDTKGNADILANQKAFHEAVARAREAFGRLDGVVSVGFGQKETGGRYKDDIAIVISVQEKKKEGDLPPEQRIPPSFEGYPTDVRVLHQAAFHGCDNTTTYDTIQGGIQIMPPMDDSNGHFHSGTLSAIVKKRSDSGRENIYLLTNKHVLFIDGGRAGQYVYHPFCPASSSKWAAPGDSNTLGPIQPGPVLANVAFTVPGDSSPTQFFVDCAAARIDIDSKCLGTTCTKDQIKTATSIVDLQVNGVNTINNVRSVINDISIINQKVYKVGRTTGKTVGIVRSVTASAGAPADPDPSLTGTQPFTAQNTIEIDFDTSSAPGGVNCKGNARFTEEGDSGSLILDEQGNAIGMHSLGAPPGSPSAFPSNACHILPILDQLNICIPVTSGTSYGSCGATDGSGAAPAPQGDFPLPSGEIEFASQSVPGVMQGVAPATSDEMLHLQDLLGSLRSTALGRELHETFALIRREIGYLVRNCRPVKVAWARNKGPAFFAHFLNHLKGAADRVPEEIEGVSRSSLFQGMLKVLSTHGSIPLRVAIEKHGQELAAMVDRNDCAQDCIACMRKKESA